MRKLMNAFIAVLFVSATAFSARKDEVTLVMVPRTDDVVRVGLDIANRFPTLLVSYKLMPDNSVSMHGWTGKEWVKIAPAAFRNGNFFKTGPDSALIVQDEDRELPTSLVPPEAWCSSVYKITTTEIRPVLHLTGQYYNFKHKDWKWFSENYKMSMEAINPEGLNVAWYHKRLDDNLKNEPVAADDLQFWVAVRYPEAATAEEEPAAETNAEESTEQPEMELPEDPDVNPLTNSVSAAVILSAGDAEEAAGTPSE